MEAKRRKGLPFEQALLANPRQSGAIAYQLELATQPVAMHCFTRDGETEASYEVSA
jgi:hypothetical protein